jgi:predicted MFS family arabinose efflux permease
MLEVTKPLSAKRTVVMATASAFAVATLYYSQPLLPMIGQSFGRSSADAGLIATVTQLGYAAGLALFVPLGDRIDKRLLIFVLLVSNMISLAACALAPGFAFLAIASGVLGLTAPTAQVIIPAVSSLARPEARGRTVGILLSGLSAGLLLARAVSGFVGAHMGWRFMFELAIVIDMLVAGIVWRMLPVVAPTTSLSYRHLLASLWELYRAEPVLRVAAATGFLQFAAFSALWGTLAALLMRAPYGFGPAATGAFGLIGIAGLLASPVVGRLTDKVGPRMMVDAGCATIILAFAFVSEAAMHFWMLIVAMVLLDIGNRMGVVANQVRIYALQPQARSRLNTVFMTWYFLGGAAGSAAGAYAGATGSWFGLALVGGSFAALALLINLMRLIPASVRRRDAVL